MRIRGSSIAFVFCCQVFALPPPKRMWHLHGWEKVKLFWHPRQGCLSSYYFPHSLPICFFREWTSITFSLVSPTSFIHSPTAFSLHHGWMISCHIFFSFFTQREKNNTRIFLRVNFTVCIMKWIFSLKYLASLALCDNKETTFILFLSLFFLQNCNGFLEGRGKTDINPVGGTKIREGDAEDWLAERRRQR